MKFIKIFKSVDSMDIWEILRREGFEKLGRWYSQYRAVVLDNLPDDKNTGNILVEVPKVQGGMKLIARAGSLQGGPGFGVKSFLPKKGEIVWVEFEYGNPTQAVWHPHTWAQDECPEELRDTASKSTCGIVTPKGHKLYLEEKEDGDALHLVFGENFTLEIDQNGLTLNQGDTQVKISDDTLYISSNKEVDVTVGQSNINVSSSKITLNGGSRGLVDIRVLQQFITAVQADLVTAKSGTQVAQFIATQLPNLEDLKVLH